MGSKPDVIAPVRINCSDGEPQKNLSATFIPCRIGSVPAETHCRSPAMQDAIQDGLDNDMVGLRGAVLRCPRSDTIRVSPFHRRPQRPVQGRVRPGMTTVSSAPPVHPGWIQSQMAYPGEDMTHVVPHLGGDPTPGHASSGSAHSLRTRLSRMVLGSA